MAVEPWDALDVDDSDLPSLLRPCKQRRSTAADGDTRTVDLLSRSSGEENQPQVQATSHYRSIPGPAGAVKAAMIRKNHDRENWRVSHCRDSEEGLHDVSRGNGRICTQEYIQRAVDTADFDDDFAGNPWIYALQYIGANYGNLRSSPISSLKKCLDVGKVALVVAVIKSCTPNGFGGLSMCLKDPTGTIGASVHHKVLCEADGKKLIIGSVIILRQAAIFAPVVSVQYLNITQKNLVKVFCQNDVYASTSEVDDSLDPTQCANPPIGGKMSSQNAVMEQQSRKAENSQCVGSRQVIGKFQPKNTSGQGDNTSSEKETAAESTQKENNRGMSNDENLEAEKSFEEEATMTRRDDDARLVNGTNESAGERDVGGKTKASLPQWTDEQLEELFAGDDEF